MISGARSEVSVDEAPSPNATCLHLSSGDALAPARVRRAYVHLHRVVYVLFSARRNGMARSPVHGERAMPRTRARMPSLWSGLPFRLRGRGRPWALCLPHRPTDATEVSSSKQFRTLRATEAGRWRFRGARGFALRSRGPAPPRPSLPHAFRSRVSARPDASQGGAYKTKWEKLLFCVPSRGLPVTHSTKSFPRLTNN